MGAKGYLVSGSQAGLTLVLSDAGLGAAIINLLLGFSFMSEPSQRNHIVKSHAT